MAAALLTNHAAFGQQWITNTPMPIGYTGQSLAYWNGYLYQAGGQGTAQGIPDGTNVYYVQVQSNGTIGSWQSGPSLPVAVLYHAGVAANGFLYVLGGFFQRAPLEGIEATNSVYYSQINSDGSLGAWQTTTLLPLKLAYLTASVWSNIIYVAGGSSSAVFSASINPDGSLSAWSTQPTLPVALRAPASAANGMLYVLGGVIGNNYQNTVYYSKINPDGSLAGWNQTTPMPQALDFIGAVATGGRVFFYGGYNGSSAVTGFYSAPVTGDGLLSSWLAGLSLPQSLYSFGTAAAGSCIVVTGGQNNSSAQHTVYSMALPSPPDTPILTAQGFVRNGNFQLQLTSSPNTGFGLLASTNLTTWTNIGWGFTGANGLLIFQDINGTGPGRFYRAYWPLP